jgi:hypothetical protein
VLGRYYASANAFYSECRRKQAANDAAITSVNNFLSSCRARTRRRRCDDYARTVVEGMAGITASGQRGASPRAADAAMDRRPVIDQPPAASMPAYSASRLLGTNHARTQPIPAHLTPTRSIDIPRPDGAQMV